MDNLPTLPGFKEELLHLQLAREIAVDHLPLDQILRNYQIDGLRWRQIKENPSFQKLLEQELATWQSALNTHERTKLKAAALVEEWLPEANQLIHSKSENLPAKVELGKLLARIAGMGLNNADIVGAGEKISVTINLGGDSQLKFEKHASPTVISGEASEVYAET